MHVRSAALRVLRPLSLLLLLLQRLLVHVHYMVFELRRRNKINLQPAEQDDTDSFENSSGMVAQKQFCGARLLQWLQERKAHGEPLLRLCTQRLMWHVYQVFFNQLTTWWVGHSVLKLVGCLEGPGKDQLVGSGRQLSLVICGMAVVVTAACGSPTLFFVALQDGAWVAAGWQQ
jgi:hypothetical protein